jgi:hypothetical protein
MLTRRTFLAAAGYTVAFPSLALGQEKLSMKALYDDADFSEQARLFDGTDISVEGFMAPPLKADAKFFVLGTAPMMICPFCDAEAQWPENIVLVYPRKELKVYSYDQGIIDVGKLDIGVKTDEQTGFVSKVRIEEAEYRGRPTVTIGF